MLFFKLFVLSLAPTLFPYFSFTIYIFHSLFPLLPLALTPSLSLSCCVILYFHLSLISLFHHATCISLFLIFIIFLISFSSLSLIPSFSRSLSFPHLCPLSLSLPVTIYYFDALALSIALSLALFAHFNCLSIHPSHFLSLPLTLSSLFFLLPFPLPPSLFFSHTLYLSPLLFFSLHPSPSLSLSPSHPPSLLPIHPPSLPPFLLTNSSLYLPISIPISPFSISLPFCSMSLSLYHSTSYLLPPSHSTSLLTTPILSS